MGVNFKDLEKFGISKDEGLFHYVAIDTTKDLSQYGVLGMKWGVRRSEGQLKAARKKRGGSSGSEAKGESDSSPAKQSRSSVASEAKNLSDEELKSRVSRLQMEKTYTDLKAGPAPKRGKTITDRILDQSKDKLAKGVVDAGAKAVAAAMKAQANKKNS